MSTTTGSPIAKPPVDLDQEVKFAVVMYGGSSLAIYINGVAQELLALVGATAPESGVGHGGRVTHLADEELRGSERVYRRLGRMLNRRGLDENINNNHPDAAQRSPVRTRFVVDILTGASAGGINAVYLAKALANDQQMGDLKNLWITEGDIGVLINDDDSYENLNFTSKDAGDEPCSVLNSRRMYLKLLLALRGMDADKAACDAGTSPLVDELDLYVTATDMFGLELRMRLADEVVREQRHRNVFRFRYRSKRSSDTDLSQFGPQYNAFLAFVARATSAHQAAFSPVKLDDALLVTERNPTDNEYPPNHAAHRVFYGDYLLLGGSGASVEATEAEQLVKAKRFQDVWFVDGGTLDNKPFSFVTEELPMRNADTFVDRKLLYIEPSPEELEEPAEREVNAAPQKRPRIVGNALAGLTSLPRYETIFEDLRRLLERNRLVERLGHIMYEMESDLINMPRAEPLDRNQFLEVLNDQMKLKDWLSRKGPSWGSYQRLRAANVTDDMALLVARAANVKEDSEEYLAVRNLVRAWRANRYDAYMEDGRRSVVEFLVEFDLLWSMRRIRFVLKKLDDLALLDSGAERIAGVPRGKSKFEFWSDKDDVDEFRASVKRLRDELNRALVNLRGERRTIWARGVANPFFRETVALEIGIDELRQLLCEPTEIERRIKAEDLLVEKLRNPTRDSSLKTRADAVEELTKAVREKLKEAIDKSRDTCWYALRRPEVGAEGELARWDLFLRDTLRYYYQHFDDFDQISYPILYSTGVGEEVDVIDVFRVSPMDATALIDEGKDKVKKKVKNEVKHQKIKKLAGTTLGNFGAFFEEKFRVNDILWGRLDGAERVIAALLPAYPGEKKLITEQAHRAIIVEEEMSKDEAVAANVEVERNVWQALDEWDDLQRRNQLLMQAAELLPVTSSFRAYVATLVHGADPLDLFTKSFIKNYNASLKFTHDATIKSAVRISRVIRGMGLGYFPPKGARTLWQKILIWLGARVTRLVEASIEPEGVARRKQWRNLFICYLISLILLGAVSLPVIVWLFSATMPWTTVGIIANLIVALPLVFLLLLATVSYDFISRKLRNKLKTILPQANDG